MHKVINLNIIPREVRKKAYLNPQEAYVMTETTTGNRSGAKIMYRPGRNGGYFCMSYCTEKQDIRELIERK